MNKKIKWLMAVAVALAVVSVGCGKRNVTVTPEDPPPPPPPPVAAPEPPPPPPPQVFQEAAPPPPPPVVDVDAVIRSAFQTVYFDYDKTDLRQETVDILSRIAAVMRENPGIRVMAEGHADERGTSAYNVGLGEGRSRGVRDFLVSYGIDVGRIEITSYGKERPANPNCDGVEECHSRNRRVEWRITAK